MANMCLPPPHSKKSSIVKVYGRNVDISTKAGQTAQQVLRQCELMDQSGTFINSSLNLDTVMQNIPVYERSLCFLTQCPDSVLKMYGLKSQKQFNDMYQSWLNQKAGAINSAVVRCCKATISHAKTLKTEKGQAKHILAFCDKSLAMVGLSAEVMELLNSIKVDMESIIGKNEATDSVQSYSDYDFDSFFALSQLIQQSGPISKRLSYCEESLRMLPDFIAACLKHDKELPPVILCRDKAPYWYMQLGQWDNAERFIRSCISCNAYYPENGSWELQYLSKYKQTASVALAFISANPGCLQKNIYKQLKGSTDPDCLKQFIRSSQLIKKVPNGNTNSLYAIISQP